MRELKILFLGAGKRLSLLERFAAAADAEGLKLTMWSVEDELRVPIASIARIAVGPRFRDDGFGSFLLGLVAKHNIHMVIPNMDSATVALSRCAAAVEKAGAAAIVSEADLCRVMEDKVLAAEWFVKHGIPVPRGDGFPRIAKNRLGFGSRDQAVVRSAAELEQFFTARRRQDYLVQPFVTGTEYTVDAYVDRAGRVVGALSRRRIHVSDGEVEVSETHRHLPLLELTARILAVPGWRGPITLQFIDSDDGALAVEVNPRFGGGVTHSIHCGLDMPRWLLREHLGLEIEPCRNWPDGSYMTRCRRDVFHDHPG